MHHAPVDRRPVRRPAPAPVPAARPELEDHGGPAPGRGAPRGRRAAEAHRVTRNPRPDGDLRRRVDGARRPSAERAGFEPARVLADPTSEPCSPVPVKPLRAPLPAPGRASGGPFRSRQPLCRGPLTRG
ncbi:hypothetical protein SGPA1_41138 [Streptomyces misionensis JCM 4497]